MAFSLSGWWKIPEKICWRWPKSALQKNDGKNSSGQEELAETPEDLLAAADAALITSFKGAKFGSNLELSLGTIPRNLRNP